MHVAQQPMQGGAYPQGFQVPGNDQVGGMYGHPMPGGQMPGINHQAMQGNQLVAYYPQQMQGRPQMGMLPQQMQAGQMASMYPQQMYGNHMAGYGYGQQQHGSQYLHQQMQGLSIRDDNALRNSSPGVSSSSYLPPMKQASKPEDKLFGDLVDIAKFKKTTPGRAGSM